MANTNNATTQLVPNSTYDLKNGICYFKLPEEYFYHEGDEVKSCGLLGTDMDSNFHFLEGYDISAVTYDYITKELNLIRVNGGVISTVIDVTLGDPTLAYDADKGILEVHYPDGTSASTSGFFTKNDLSPIYTDETIRGNGEDVNPLRLSELEKTAVFAPVNDYLDIFDTNELPVDYTIENGYRILTKEKVSDFGVLYDYSAVEDLQNSLSGTPWRVPSKEDWLELIDAIGEDEEWKNNEAMLLKSADYWVSGAGYDSFGFRALPTGFDSNPLDDTVVDFGRATCFWSHSSADTNEAYVFYLYSGGSIIHYDEPKLGHHFAIRLVKDYEPGTVSEYEDILGTTLPTKVINICDSYSKVWTVANFYYWDNRITGITADEISGVTNTGYFINEWNGEAWERKRLNDGESVVIINKEGSEPYREWRLVNGELIDTLADAEERAHQLEERVETLEAQMESATTRIFNLESGLTIANVRIEKLESGLTIANGRIEELESALTVANGRIEELEHDVEVIKASAMTETDVINLIKDTIIGTDREIKVTAVDDKVQIGFEDDSIFGETDGLIN